jgi:hypothetical protein
MIRLKNTSITEICDYNFDRIDKLFNSIPNSMFEKTKIKLIICDILISLNEDKLFKR